MLSVIIPILLLGGGDECGGVNEQGEEEIPSCG